MLTFCLADNCALIDILLPNNERRVCGRRYHDALTQQQRNWAKRDSSSIHKSSTQFSVRAHAMCKKIVGQWAVGWPNICHVTKSFADRARGFGNRRHKVLEGWEGVCHKSKVWQRFLFACKSFKTLWQISFHKVLGGRCRSLCQSAWGGSNLTKIGHGP